MSSRFPRVSSVARFLKARLAPVSPFPALGASCMFPWAWWRFHLFLFFPCGVCFLAFAAGSYNLYLCFLSFVIGLGDRLFYKTGCCCCCCCCCCSCLVLQPVVKCCITLSLTLQDIKLTSSNDDDYFVFEDVLCQVRTVKK